MSPGNAESFIIQSVLRGNLRFAPSLKFFLVFEQVTIFIGTLDLHSDLSVFIQDIVILDIFFITFFSYFRLIVINFCVVGILVQRIVCRAVL